MFSTFTSIVTGVLIGYFGIPLIQKSGITEYMQRKMGEYEFERAERIRKEKEADDLFNERKEEAMNSFLTELSNDFIQEPDFCKKDIISQLNKEDKKIYNLIDKLNTTENFEDQLNERIRQTLDDLSNKMSKININHLNILLIGPSGVGKSFLINTLLKLDKKHQAKTKNTKPTTKTFDKYESKKVPNIRLIDSRGLEKGNYNSTLFIKEVIDFIEQQELNGNPDEFIHCIWYCVTGTRFEDIEEDILFKLNELYDDNTLPIIVVYTQAMVPEYYNAIENEIRKIKKDIEYIPVVADDIKIADNHYVKSKNLDKLLVQSLEKSKNAVYSSVFSSLKKNILTEIEKNIERGNSKIVENLQKYISYQGNISTIHEFDEDKEFKNIIKKIYFDEKSKHNLKSESQSLIRTFSHQIHKKNEDIINKCLDDFVSKNAETLSNELNDIQTQVNIEKEGNFRNIKNKKQLIKMITPTIKKSLQQKALDLGFLNYLKFFPEKLSQVFSNKIKEHFNHLIADSSTKNVINAKIKEQFQKILSSIENLKFSK